jgi:hypothetical protein
MAETNDKENSGNTSRREFLIAAGAAPVVAATGLAVDVGSTEASGAAAYPTTQQGVLSRIMLRAQNAELRISHGISAGVLEEVSKGAMDFAAAMKESAEHDIKDPSKQKEWSKRSLGLAENAEQLGKAAKAALEKGELEVNSQIVQLYVQGISLEAACHRDFRAIEGPRPR